MYRADQSEVIQGLFPFTTMELEPVKKLACLQTFFLVRFCFCQNPRSPLFPKQITNNKRKVFLLFYTLPDFAFCFKLRWPLSWRRKRKKPRWPLSPNEEARNSFRTPCSHCQECFQFLLHIRDHVLLVSYNFIIIKAPKKAFSEIKSNKSYNI